jgi:hypothetical protein
MPSRHRARAFARAESEGDDMHSHQLAPPRSIRCARTLTIIAACCAALASGAARVVACDLCAIYTATEMGESRSGFQLGVAEQYSRFTTLKDDGHDIPNEADERMSSSVTQVLFGYNFGPRVGLQLAVPIITRQFHRLENGALRAGDETGFGDLSLIGIVRPFSTVTEQGIVRLSLFGGLKLPSGSSARLGEELDEDHHDSGAEHTGGEAVGSVSGMAAHETAEVSGIHGHDLALGSGSVDGIIGGQVFWTWRRLFAGASLPYAVRTEGAFDYRYANDLIWSGGPGAFVWLGHDGTCTLQALTTGEHKGTDTLAGQEEGDTAITAVYLGPSLGFTWGTSLAAEVAADLPILRDNSGVQLVPDYRVRGGVTWRF